MNCMLCGVERTYESIGTSCPARQRSHKYWVGPHLWVSPQGYLWDDVVLANELLPREIQTRSLCQDERLQQSAIGQAEQEFRRVVAEIEPVVPFHLMEQIA